MCCNDHEQTPNIKGTFDGNSSYGINIESCKLLIKLNIKKKETTYPTNIQILMNQHNIMILCFNEEKNRYIFKHVIFCSFVGQREG